MTVIPFFTLAQDALAGIATEAQQIVHRLAHKQDGVYLHRCGCTATAAR
jgi:hypothetical protein